MNFTNVKFLLVAAVLGAAVAIGMIGLDLVPSANAQVKKATRCETITTPNHDKFVEFINMHLKSGFEVKTSGVASVVENYVIRFHWHVILCD